MKQKISKLIRIITVAPVMALATLLTLYVHDSELFGSHPYMLLLAIFFLTVLPLLAYPLQPITPYFKSRGREGQRNLAMLFAVSGYILGCITNLFLSAPASLWIIYLDYMLSGVLIVVFNKLLHLRASAHACGIIGPATLLAYFGIPLALAVGAVLYIAAAWASITMKRHTLPQLLGGAAISLAVLGFLHVILAVL